MKLQTKTVSRIRHRRVNILSLLVLGSLLLFANSSQVAVSGYPAFTYVESFEDPAQNASGPHDLQAHSSGLYVAFRGTHQIARFDYDGTYTALFGGFGTAQGQLYLPQGIYYNTSHYVVSESGNHRIQVFDEFFVSQQMLGGTIAGNEDNEFYDPQGITGNGTHLFVADYGNHRVQVFKNDLSYAGTIGTGIAGIGDDQLDLPIDVVINDSLVYVAEYGNQRVHVFDSSFNHVSSFWTGGVPAGITIVSGKVAVSLQDTYQVTIFEGSEAVYSLGGYEFGNVQHFLSNQGVVFNGTHLFVTDGDASTIAVFEYHPDGVIATETVSVTETQQVTVGPTVTVTEVVAPVTTDHVTSTHIITTEVTNAKSEAPAPLIPIFIAILSISAFRFTRKK